MVTIQGFFTYENTCDIRFKNELLNVNIKDDQEWFPEINDHHKTRF